MTITFEPVIDDLIEYANDHGSPVLVVGGRVDQSAFAILWNGGGVETSRITADVRVNLEMWVSKDDALAEVRAERYAADLCAVLSSRPAARERRPAVFDVEWVSLPAALPIASRVGAPDQMDAALWARVVAQCVVKTRGVAVLNPAQGD